MRLEYEGLASCPDVVDKDSRFHGKPAEYAMQTFSYFMCSCCEEPYFGGRAECCDGGGLPAAAADNVEHVESDSDDEGPRMQGMARRLRLWIAARRGHPLPRQDQDVQPAVLAAGPPEETLLCPNCRAAAEGREIANCDLHGRDFIEYKCKFCCSVSSWFHHPPLLCSYIHM
jgi:E3 ubiquitin-protein ligase MYCBP2